VKNPEKSSDKLYTSLREIGLSHKAAELYQLSLRSGGSPIAFLAKSLDVSRPNVYALIKELAAKGLAKPAAKNGYSRHFSVETPTLVLEKLRAEKENMETLESSIVSEMPDLLTLYHQGESPTKIKVLQGREQYLKIFNQSVEESRGEIQFFGSADDFIHFVSWKTENEWIKKRLKNKIFLRALLLPGDDAQTLKEQDESELRETRILTDTKPFSASFMLFSNKLIFWQPKVPLALSIEDEYITETMQIVFEKLWASTNN